MSLAACAGLAPAQQPQPAASNDKATVQDGIKVRPLSRFRVLSSGEQFEAQSRQQYAQMMQQANQKGVLVAASDPQTQRLRGIAKKLIPYTTRWNQDAAKWEWQVNLIESPQVNAFCMPGGRIGFFTGILNQLKLTDDEAAAIMGHEIAHALREHGRAQQGKNVATSVGTRVLGALGAAVLGIDPSVTDTVARAATQGFALKYSRDDEREADLIGLDIAARAGFDPRAGVVLWQKMGALSKRAPPQFLSTHPGGAARIEAMNQHMDVLLPLYARSKGTSVRNLPPYRTYAMK